MQLKQLFRTILVVGDEPENIIKKYSLNTKVQPYLYLSRNKVETYKEYKIKCLQENLKLDFLTESQKMMINEQIEIIKEMTDDDFFFGITEGCSYDEHGDAYTTDNPNAFYCNERSPQAIFEKTGETTGFCNPFKLYDDYISYSSYKKDIDWSLMHKNNANVYKRAWEIVMEGDKPKTKEEKIIKNNMINHKGYFSNFDNKEEYINYSTSFWTYGIATDSFYEEVGMYDVTDKEWITNFYDKYIKNLPEDTLLTIYEVQGIE